MTSQKIITMGLRLWQNSISHFENMGSFNQQSEYKVCKKCFSSDIQYKLNIHNKLSYTAKIEGKYNNTQNKKVFNLQYKFWILMQLQG